MKRKTLTEKVSELEKRVAGLEQWIAGTIVMYGCPPIGDQFGGQPVSWEIEPK